MITGTSHFVSRRAAFDYYREQEIDAKGVNQKIDEGSIRIGRPDTPKGSHVFIIPDEGRYAYVD